MLRLIGFIAVALPFLEIAGFVWKLDGNTLDIRK